jgi:hypothetical protein
MHEIELSGLDGRNLLAFLAALGAMRVLVLASPDALIRMRWHSRGGWVPVVLHSKIASEDELLEVLEACVCGEQSVNQTWKIAPDLTIGRVEFSQLLRDCLEMTRPSDRGSADFLAAFGSEAFGKGPKNEQMSDTKLRALGGGQQRFLGSLCELAGVCDREHLRRSLFAEWDYGDGRPSLRWDPSDYRPHALRADDPAKDPIRTMRGANRLAIEALPLFPTVPCGRRVRTVGFNDDNEITWPIWRVPLDLDSAASLLASAEIQESRPDRLAASRRAISQVLRARRFTDGKYRNFSPAREML